MNESNELDIRNMISKVTIEVSLRNYGQRRVRLWFAEKLFRLAAWIAWFDIDIEETEEDDYN